MQRPSQKKNNILIIAALKNELNPVKEKLLDTASPKYNLNFLITGIGSAKTIDKLVNYTQSQSIDIIINIGSCGSLDDELKIGEIVFPEKFYSKSDENQKLFEISIQDNHKLTDSYKTGVIFTSKTPVASTDEKILLKKTSNADVVDMESYWVADFCQQHNIRFLSIKVVSDFSEGISIKTFKEQMKKVAGNLVAPVEHFLETIE